MTYVVTVNAPGYLPETEPQVFERYEDAFVQLCEELKQTRAAQSMPEYEGAELRLREAMREAWEYFGAEGKARGHAVRAFGLIHSLERLDS